jgi:hypothetical protein
MGHKGFPVTMPVCQDQLPSAINGKFMCKEQTSNNDKKSRIAHFNHPIMAVKICTVPELVLLDTGVDKEQGPMSTPPT